MNKFEFVKTQCEFLYEMYVDNGCISEKWLMDEMSKLHDFAITTEDASQTVREGELLNEDGLVQLTDNAGATPDLDMGVQRIDLMGGSETNDGGDSKKKNIVRNALGSSDLRLTHLDDDEPWIDEDRPY